MNTETETSKTNHNFDNSFCSGNLSLVEQAKAILVSPVETWAAIKSEATTTGTITRNYLLPLLFASGACLFIGAWLFGELGFSSSLVLALRKFVILLVSVFVAASLVEYFTPRFEGRASRRDTFALVTYSLTGLAVPNMLSLFPALSSLGGLLGTYCLYLFYQGVSPMLEISQERRPAFTVIVVISTLFSIGVLLLFARLLAFQA